jgi:hypothetical protein
MTTFNISYAYTDPFDATQNYEGGVDVEAVDDAGAREVFFQDHSRQSHAIQFIMDRTGFDKDGRYVG